MHKFTALPTLQLRYGIMRYGLGSAIVQQLADISVR